MTFKEFIKPSIIKIILTILIIVSHIFLIVIGFYCGWDSVIMNSTQCKFLLMTIYNIILLPSVLLELILEIRFNPFETSANPIISTVIQLIWSYTLSCIIVWISNKIKNNFSTSKN